MGIFLVMSTVSTGVSHVTTNCVITFICLKNTMLTCKKLNVMHNYCYALLKTAAHSWGSNVGPETKCIENSDPSH